MAPKWCFAVQVIVWPTRDISTLAAVKMTPLYFFYSADNPEEGSSFALARGEGKLVWFLFIFFIYDCGDREGRTWLPSHVTGHIMFHFSSSIRHQELPPLFMFHMWWLLWVSHCDLTPMQVFCDAQKPKGEREKTHPLWDCLLNFVFQLANKLLTKNRIGRWKYRT